MDKKELALKAIDLRLSNLNTKLNMTRDPLARASIVADIETARMERIKIEKSLPDVIPSKEEVKVTEKEEKEIPVLNRGIVSESPAVEEAEKEVENLLDSIEDNENKKEETSNNYKNDKYNNNSNKKKH